MIPTQSSLVQFEQTRKSLNFIPPDESNSFYKIGSSQINLMTIRNDPEDPRFDLYTDQGNVYSGAGEFFISGDIVDKEYPYRNLTVIENTKLSVNQNFSISRGEVMVYGSLELLPNSRIMIENNASVIFHPSSVFIINPNSALFIGSGATLTIYGRIDIDLVMIKSILNNENIIIDTSAILNVSGINIPGRTVSLTDYEKELRNKLINLYTQSDIDYGVNRIGYQWTAGTPEEDSHAIQLNVLLGDAVLGDFRLAALGIPEVVKPETKIVSNILVKKKTTLYIGESFNGYKYIMPELYLGIIIGNNKTPADCTVQGKLIVDGPNSKITVDRGATIHIDAGGELYLKNGSIMRSGYNEHFPIIFIDGTLIIDDLSQIATFNMDNFEFGENGKVVILNPDTGKKKLLFTTPNGIHNSELYRLFEKHTNHLEFHLSKNTGIGIDTYYKFYARDMKDWIGGLRIEKAIKEGIIVWHDGAFIELYSNVTPWVSANSTLLEASRIFKTIGSYDPEKLQDAVNRLNYAGCGNILFRFIYPTGEHELLLTLDGINMKGILNNPLHNRYELSTDNTGSLYIRNRIKDSTIKQIINKASRVIDVPDTYKGVFNLP